MRLPIVTPMFELQTAVTCEKLERKRKAMYTRFSNVRTPIRGVAHAFASLKGLKLGKTYIRKFVSLKFDMYLTRSVHENFLGIFLRFAITFCLIERFTNQAFVHIYTQS